MSRRAQQHAEAERRVQQRAEQQKEETQYSAARILDAYIKSFEEYHGTSPQITYKKGWYHIARGRTYDAYRATDIIKMTSTLMARIHQRQMNEDVEHPELLTQGE